MASLLIAPDLFGFGFLNVDCVIIIGAIKRAAYSRIDPADLKSNRSAQNRTDVARNGV